MFQKFPKHDAHFSNVFGVRQFLAVKGKIVGVTDEHLSGEPKKKVAVTGAVAVEY